MNICVYGAASQQIHTDFLQGAHQLGHCLAKAGFGLVFGGGNTGVMGACARALPRQGAKYWESHPASSTKRACCIPAAPRSTSPTPCASARR